MRSGALGLAALTIAMILSIRPIRNAAFEFFLVTHIIFIMYVRMTLFLHTSTLSSNLALVANSIFLVGGYYHAKSVQ